MQDRAFQRKAYGGTNLVVSLFLIPTLLLLANCVTALETQEKAPSEASLKQSFAEQIKSSPVVKDFSQNGDDIFFTAGPAKWRVHINKAVVEPKDDEMKPYKGTIQSVWYKNGNPANEMQIPLAFISAGIGPNCWAFWGKRTKRWNWTE
ncbi:MAG: hypothetical protein ABIN58_01260 [candidate division WOR-3 bacterium]